MIDLIVNLLYAKSRQPARSTLFPYTTLFRSGNHLVDDPVAHAATDRRRARQVRRRPAPGEARRRDRKSTRLNSSHSQRSYAVFCVKKKSYLSGYTDNHQHDDAMIGHLDKLVE